MRLSLVTALVTAGVALLTTAYPAAAQPRGRVGLIAGGSWIDADFVAGGAPVWGATAGAGVRPWLDMEADVVVPSHATTRVYSGTSLSVAPVGASRDETERLSVVTRFTNERQTLVVISVVAAFHAADTNRRVVPRLLIGITSHRIHDQRRLEHLSLPPGVTREQVDGMMPREESRRRQIGGPTVGASVDLMLTPRLIVAPDVRYDYMSVGDEINNAVRSSIRLMWKF